MNAIYNAFVVIHIRLNDVKFGRFKAEFLLTIIIIILLIVSLLRFIGNFNVDITDLDISYSSYFFRIVRRLIILLLTTFTSFFWLISWPKSARAINSAGRGGSDGMQDSTFNHDRMQDKPQDIEAKKQQAREKAKKYDSPFESNNQYFEKMDKRAENFNKNDGSYMSFDKEIQEKREALRKKMLKEKDE